MKERKIRSSAHILTGSYDPSFADLVAAHVNLNVEETKITHFANTELKAEVPTVRGDHVFVIQSHGAPVSETLMEQVAIVNAARRASATDVTAIVPYRGYGRADRPDNSHESFMGPIAMRLLALAGANRIVEVDPHAGQSSGFIADFSTEYTAVPSYPIIQTYIEDRFLNPFGRDDVVIVSPDSGRAKLNRHYAERLGGLPRAIVDKHRTGTNQAEASEVVGAVEGKRCIMIDDMVDTTGTLIQGAEALMNLGAKEVNFITTHGILSGPAIERLASARERGIIGRIAVTDTLRLPDHTPDDLIDVISVAPLVGDAIRCIFEQRSVSAMFEA